ncbi:hypothetical protein EC950183_2004, partial [Escherichia coli 95.0183]
FRFLLSLTARTVLTSLLISFAESTTNALSASLSLSARMARQRSIPAFFNTELSLLSPGITSALSPKRCSSCLISSSGKLLITVTFCPR